MYPELAWGLGIILIIVILLAELKFILEKLKPPIVALNSAFDVMAITLLIVATVFDYRIIFVAVILCIISGIYVTYIYSLVKSGRIK